MKQLKIGNVLLENSYVLGPMAGVTDLPFRLLCKEQGAGLLCMEMVSAKGIFYNNKNTESLLQIHPEEVPVSLQFFGSDPKIVSEMAKRVEERPFSILDINMGGRQAFPLSRHDWICCLFFCQDQFGKKSMQSKKMNTLPIFLFLTNIFLI